jgi:RimJ/RimL family protein N-acetyltransferase
VADASRIFGEEGDLRARQERAQWLEWSAMNYRWLDRLKQPPFGDYAMVERETNVVVGACGFVPSFAPFGQLDFEGGSFAAPSTRNTIEVGLYYHVDPSRRRRGYATDAARALTLYGCEQLHLARIVATTTYDNHASIGVMAKLKMRVGRNRLSTTGWPQVVGMTDFEGV